MTLTTAQADYDAFRAQGLKLDMSRGKPAPEQLDLSNDLLGPLGDHLATDGTDTRNYGGGIGLPEARALFASLLDQPVANVIVDSNASLSLMHDVIVYHLLHGAPDQPSWLSQKPVKFLCPVPGYDRHFSICLSLGIEMINVRLNDDGPDMDQVEALVANDPAIKGMWCVPKYANPSGAVYSDAAVTRLANMKTAAADFRLMWDDAYRLHHLTTSPCDVANILSACEAAGHADRAFIFASTSKITLAGAGMAAMAASASNLQWWQKHANIRSIGPDKVNQLRHVRFLKDRANVEALMMRHQAILRPKFDAVLAQFEAHLSGIAEVSWTHPNGGYFIDLQTPPGFAKKTVELAKAAGITLTPAGAAFPYGKDPQDRHIRIAPSFPSLGDITEAAKGIALCLKLALAS
ncbi:aminotransferase [Leeia aquatica]|uniref:Aminotransferase n=1 Tax=Leeia aquatica TaxID=2725557 RepID=A0A847S7Z0_9NEIS|nr:aminotransferase [Leeia aquatica]NLR75873.1 aminotransferase [Leeia aquatica]